MKKKIGDLTLNEIVKQIKTCCEKEKGCDNCPLYVLDDCDCIETKCKLIFSDLNKEIEVEDNE